MFWEILRNNQISKPILRVQQNKEIKFWNGIDIDFCGKPGTSNLISKKVIYPDPEKKKRVDEKQRSILNMLNKLRELEGKKNNFFQSEEDI